MDEDQNRPFEITRAFLTNDNLGLKTWGSALILSQRLLVHDHTKYLYKSVLELGSELV